MIDLWCRSRYSFYTHAYKSTSQLISNLCCIYKQDWSRKRVCFTLVIIEIYREDIGCDHFRFHFQYIEHIFFRIRHDSEVSKTHVPASRNNARVNPNGNVSFNQPISTKKNSPPNITIIKTDSNAGQLKVHQPLPLRHTLSDNKYPNKRDVGQKFSSVQ